MSETFTAARLSPVDLVRVGSLGLRSRPARVLLSALGIAIGVASMMAVLGISASSKAEITRRLDMLGTNLLRVAPAKDLSGHQTSLPATAPQMISAIAPVISVASVASVPTAIYRSDLVPTGRTSSVAVLAVQGPVLETLGATMSRGHWLEGATAQFPAVVLGAAAAERLDTHTIGSRLWLGGTWVTVVGILQPIELAPELDQAALVGWRATASMIDQPLPSTVYLRVDEAQIQAVAGVLPRTAKPRAPAEVAVSRPSDAIAARAATDSALTSMLLGLGAVALIVGGIGVANTMVISVLERRSEIGLRRALGATRGQIRVQFVAESLILAGLGGVGGVVLGALVTFVYAVRQAWPPALPVWAGPTGLAVTLVVGVLAGVYPAARASAMSPTAALAGEG